MNTDLGKAIIIIGFLLIIIGLSIIFFGDYLRWIGRLPGDIYIKRENFTFYFPIVTMILISIVVSLLIKLYKMYF